MIIKLSWNFNFLAETVKAALIFPRLGVPSCSPLFLLRLQSRREVVHKYLYIRLNSRAKTLESLPLMRGGQICLATGIRASVAVGVRVLVTGDALLSFLHSQL